MVKYWFPVHGTSRRSGTFTSEDGPKEDLITVHKHLRLQAPPTRGYLRLLDYNLIIPTVRPPVQAAGSGPVRAPPAGQTGLFGKDWKQRKKEEKKRKQRERELRTRKPSPSLQTGSTGTVGIV